MLGRLDLSGADLERLSKYYARRQVQLTGCTFSLAERFARTAELRKKLSHPNLYRRLYEIVSALLQQY